MLFFSQKNIMRTLILNSSNIVENTNNSILSYQFAGGNVNFKKGDKIALASLQQYSSLFNISVANNNNMFAYIWVDESRHFATIPDGYYTVDAINNYIRFVMVQKYHYMVTPTGDFVYFFNLSVNPTGYGNMVTGYCCNTTIATANGWTLPPMPTISVAPPFQSLPWIVPNITPFNSPYGGVIPLFSMIATYIPSNLNTFPSQTVVNFWRMLGFSQGGGAFGSSSNLPRSIFFQGQPYPALYQTIPPFISPFTGFIQTTSNPNYTIATRERTNISNLVPQMPTTSLIMTCSLINNNYAVPNNLLYSFGTSNIIGEQFTIAPNQYVPIDILAGQYSRFDVSFLDQNLNPVKLNDPNMVIQLVVIGNENSDLEK